MVIVNVIIFVMHIYKPLSIFQNINIVSWLFTYSVITKLQWQS